MLKIKVNPSFKWTLWWESTFGILSHSDGRASLGILSQNGVVPCDIPSLITVNQSNTESCLSRTGILCTRYIMYTVYYVHGILCTQYIMYTVYYVHGILCTRYIIYMVYYVHSILCTRYIIYMVYYVHSILCTRYIMYMVYYVHSILCTRYIMYTVQGGPEKTKPKLF